MTNGCPDVESTWQISKIQAGDTRTRTLVDLKPRNSLKISPSPQFKDKVEKGQIFATDLEARGGVNKNDDQRGSNKVKKLEAISQRLSV